MTATRTATLRQRIAHGAGPVAAALLAALLAGCTSDTGDARGGASSAPANSAAADVEATTTPAPSADQTVRITAGDDLKFSPSSLTVKPGRVRVILTVSGTMPQTFTAPDLNADTGVVQPGNEATIDLVIALPGEYTFFSAYHREQGMQGVLVVK